MKYFAYGSNMNPDRMKEREVGFSEREPATLEGYKLRFNKMSSKNPEEACANIVPDNEGRVEGVLYEINGKGLDNLDEHERYPDHYDRVRVKVLLENGEEVEAITYIAQPEVIKDGIHPSRVYLDHLLEAKDLLPEEYVKRLEGWETSD